jgi:hypothetical protein
MRLPRSTHHVALGHTRVEQNVTRPLRERWPADVGTFIDLSERADCGYGRCWGRAPSGSPRVRLAVTRSLSVVRLPTPGAKLNVGESCRIVRLFDVRRCSSAGTRDS